MKLKELRTLEESKLQKALEDAKKELIQLGKSSKKRNIRRQIARILTINREEELKNAAGKGATR
ncbi:MAG: large ribosomal subunit protein uL29 [Candidatus Micrarchaeia archaeon]